MVAAKQKRVRSKSPIVYRIPLVGTPVSTPFLGHEGPRPQLSFVLKTLAGDDSGMTEFHLSIQSVCQTAEEIALWETIVADPLSVQIATNSMVAMMRNLADLWIDSGKSGEGESRMDNPSRRNVVYMPPFETLKKIVLSVDPADEFQLSGWNCFSIPVGLPISNLFYQLIGNEERWPEIREDGTQSLKELIFGFKSETFQSGHRLGLHWFGMKVAMYWFAKLLNSPFSRQLARCDDCSAYFAYERAPKKEIRGGTHCTNCKGQGSARRMKSTRERRTGEMVGFAVDALALWKPNSRHSSRSKWVADQVNRRTARIKVKLGKKSENPYPRITGRWFSQHQTEIELEVERRRNAKG